MSVHNDLNTNLNKDYFTIEDHRRNSWVDSFTDFFKKILGFGSENRLKLKHGIDEVSIGMRVTPPSFVGSRQWVQVDLGEEHQPIYLNINSITERTWLKPEHVNSANLVQLLNSFSEPPGIILEAIPPENEGRKKTFEELEELAFEYQQPDEPKLVTAAQMQAAVTYVDRNRDGLQARLDEQIRQSGNDYIVLRKEETGLSHNLEYYGPNEVLLRFHTDFVRGSNKWVSKMVDLYDKELISKSKFLVHDRENLSERESRKLKQKAEAYRRARNDRFAIPRVNRPYRVDTISSVAEARIEAMIGQNTSGALKTRRFVTYKKEHSIHGNQPARVHKAAIYALLQKKSLEKLPDGVDKKQVARGLIKNMAAFHRHNICHNDTKGGNFLWNRVGGQITTRLIDMGFASEFNENSSLNANYNNYSNMGTIKYIPPEIFEENSEPSSLTKLFKLNKAKDAYGVGMTLYHDVYGCGIPWEEELPRSISYGEHDELLHRMNNTESLRTTMMRRAVPQEMQNVILGLMHPDPALRMTIEQAERALGRT